MTSTDSSKTGIGAGAAAPGRPGHGSSTAPGPALTSPEEIGADTGAGGPMPDRIGPGDDTQLSVSPAAQDHDRQHSDGAAGGKPPA